MPRNQTSSIAQLLALNHHRRMPVAPHRLFVREEYDTEQGEMVVRVLGLPRDSLQGTGAKLRSALDAPVFIEGRELLVAKRDRDRVASLLQRDENFEVVIVGNPEPTNPMHVGRPGGTVRAEIRRGLLVAVVTKADQETGALTEGVVRDILTRSPQHPRGIKVRLESGQVGRVRRILSPVAVG